MSYLTYEMMCELKKANFSFPDYEHFLNLGMVYHYHGEDYFIGGGTLGEFTEYDKEVAENGCWLPNEADLLEWLKLVGFNVLVQLDGELHHYNIKAVDCQNKKQYMSSGIVLAHALAKLVYKICKSNCRSYIPSKIIRLKIENEPNSD